MVDAATGHELWKVGNNRVANVKSTPLALRALSSVVSPDPSATGFALIASENRFLLFRIKP